MPTPGPNESPVGMNVADNIGLSYCGGGGGIFNDEGCRIGGGGGNP